MTKIIKFFEMRAAREHRFSELVRPHIGSLYRMAYRWTQDRDDAEDLVQEALTKLVGRVDDMERVEKLGPWLVKVQYRCFVDLYRKRSRSPDGENPGWRADTDLLDERIAALPEGADVIRRLELQRDLARAMEGLSGEQRDVILLHDTEGYSIDEVASIMEISAGTVKSRLHRAREQLKKYLGDGTF